MTEKLAILAIKLSFFLDEDKNILEHKSIQPLFERNEQVGLFETVNGVAQLFCILAETKAGDKTVDIPDFDEEEE